MSVGSSPAFPNIKKIDYGFLINHVNIALSRKILTTTIKISKKTFNLIKILHRVGCIKNYLIFNKKFNYVKFSIFFYKNTPFFSSIRLISTSSKKIYISLKALKKLSLFIKSTVYVLSTPYGLLTHYEALKKQTGGLLICTVG